MGDLQYEGFDKLKNNTQRVQDNSIGFEIPAVFRIYMGDKVRFVSDFGLGLRVPLIYSTDLEEPMKIGYNQITSEKDYSNVALIGCLGFGLNSQIGPRMNYSVIVRKSFNDAQLRDGFSAGFYSINFIFTWKEEKKDK